MSRHLAMRFSTSIGVLALTLAAFVAGGTDAAHAATTWYAGPTGSGDSCTQHQPCALDTAVNTAVAGTKIVVLPGSYGTVQHPVTYTLANDLANITVTGEPGAKAPWIYFGGASGGLSLSVEGDSVSWLNVSLAGTDDVPAVYLWSGAHIFATSHQLSYTCDVLSQFTDSACLNTGVSGTGLEVGVGGFGSKTFLTTTIRNVTALASGSDSTGAAADGGYNCVCSVTFTNDVFQGSSFDLVGSEQTTGTLAMTVAYSSYVKAQISAPATLGDLGHNIDKHASFVNVAKNNLRETPASPTIDAGQRVAGSDTDLAGHPRTVGAGTDMGAYEYLSPPKLGKVSVASRRKRSVALKAVVNPGTLATTIQLVATRHGGPTRKSKLVSAGHGKSGRAVKLTVSKLVAGKKYTLTVVASNLGGKVKKTRHVRTRRP